MVGQSIGIRPKDSGRTKVEQAVLELAEAESRLRKETKNLAQLNRHALNEPWKVSQTVSRYNSAAESVTIARRHLSRAWDYYDRTERIGVPALVAFGNIPRHDRSD